MCMDAKTDDNFSLICDRFLRQKGNNFHIQGNDSKKGGVCGPATPPPRKTPWASFSDREQRFIKKTARAFAERLRAEGFIPREE